MWYHKFLILLVILFLILGVTFYALIDSEVLESDEVQNVVHFFDKKESTNVETESVSEEETESTNETTNSTEAVENENGENSDSTEEKTDESTVVEVTSV